jgi:hypothetical protein
MENYFTWGFLSALLIAISAVPYAWGIYKHTVPRPVLSAWGIWAALGGLLLLTYHDSGATMETTLPAAWMGFVNPLIVFALAWRYSERSWSRLETWCVIAFVITVIAWKTSDLAIIGLAGGIIADSMGAIPQIKHTWKAPKDEPWFPWTLFCIGSGVNLLGVEKWGWGMEELGYSLFPLYMTIGSLTIVTPILLDKFGLRTR